MAGKFATTLFKPSIRRRLERGTARTADITLSQGKIANSEGYSFPSGTFRYDPSGVALKNVQQLNVDFSEFQNHTFFNSAAAKTQIAFEKIINHLDIIYKDMISILKKNNIHPIESIGKKLDPNLHQAMMEIEDENKENGIILQEIQKGFMMKDRLLRPSLVGVAKKVDKKQQNPTENSKNEEKK